MAAAAILKNKKNRDVAATVWPICTKFGMLKNLNFTNRRCRTAAILKTVKLLYLCNPFTDFDEILHGDKLAPYSRMTVKISNF